jgi:hypothetical protein
LLKVPSVRAKTIKFSEECKWIPDFCFRQWSPGCDTKAQITNIKDVQTGLHQILKLLCFKVHHDESEK